MLKKHVTNITLSLTTHINTSSKTLFFTRLNIVSDPVEREKALSPIVDDIGRTFFQCPYCHKLFGSTSDMNRHLDFHEGIAIGIDFTPFQSYIKFMTDS